MVLGLKKLFFRSVDASSLAVFRIMFGALMLFESVNYGLFLCLDCLYRNTALLFKYHHFEWVTLWPANGLEWHLLLMAVSSVCIMLGLFYRLAMIIFTLCFIYIFLLDQALYLNHFYLVILISVIMIFVPANTYWAMDAKLNPKIASATVPNWGRFWIGAQLEIILIYAGLVKLNLDWLNLEPMRLWMNNQSSRSHEIFQWLTQDPGIAIASYGVILLHIVGAPLLLFKKTRLIVLAIYAFFHLTNAFVFDIGIFPFLTFAATLLLFDPSWPRQFVAWLNQRGKAMRWRHISQFASSVQTPKGVFSVSQWLIVVMISMWLLVQLTVPWRHFFIPGNVAWNEAGHRFSWRMKLRDKQGTIKFVLYDENDERVEYDPQQHLNRRQLNKMACIPDMIWQYAQFIEQDYIAAHNQKPEDVKVYVDAMCSLNTREPAPLINRLIDITAIPRNEPVQNWVLPLSKALPRRFI